ncbi:hypothetical protein [Nocardia alni]|uniref:hypothetical protein n=1 Tax=Nocardia alni TaxID=2815723 RepID=UPI001C220A8E|nr:hypothetical protein [Nocardia alni]
MGPQREFFARLVKDTRVRRGWAIEDVQKRGGPGRDLVMDAEHARLPDELKPSTWQKFDAGFGWPEGSAVAAYYEGRRPRVDDAPVRELQSGAGRVPMDIARVVELWRAHEGLHASTPATMSEAVKTLDAAVSAIIRPVIIDVLERNRGGNNPLMDFGFAAILATPVPDDDPDALERKYARYLMGYTDGLTEDLRCQFEQRYQLRTRGEP